ncbi:MAG TPA: tetratricopeptide repeat protein [Sedimenticola thiotaurini]|uniref:Ancillary SecYEG translocon subunit n=1 Tax=Sedimenticola thiotaurini TaxID=1543721 RepID=A0A831RMU5_9GAMM|nr:tetratricopeptide repeat protein [Sedimenticola thiotaurini]
MVDVNLSEEEQVEALKKWWKENGRSVVGGVVLGLGAVFGWQAWQQHQQSIADQASVQFEQLNQSLIAGVQEPAVKQAEQLIGEYGDTPYALFAALDLARVRLGQGKRDAALAQLQWVVDTADEPSFRQIARLRMARIQLDAGNLDAAGALIDQAGNDAYRGEFAELKGDLALARGDRKAAGAAYREALAGGVGSASLVQMKLDDLAVGPEG